MNLADDAEPEVRLDQLVADYIEARERGEPVDVERWLMEHAEFTEELLEFLRGYSEACAKKHREPT